MKIHNATQKLMALSALAMIPFAQGQACFDDASTKYFPKEDWRYCQQIEPNLFMYYTALEDEGNVMLGLHATSDASGWTALALAGNGGMKGASQIVVRQDEQGEWMVEDRHSMDYVTPTMDDSQDAKLLFADQTEEGETAWGVLLMINPCDEPNDYPIEDRIMYMHWALGSDHSFFFHGSRRGQFKANLLQAPKVLPTAEGLDYVDILMPNVPVVLGEGGQDPSNPYICSFFDLSLLLEGTHHDTDDKIHAIRLSPQLAEGSGKYVHHLTMYACVFDGEGKTDDGFPFDVDTVEHHGITPQCEIMPRGCYEMKYGWAVGGSDIILPPDVGLPFGEGRQWVALQVHYYNPNLDEGITDSSGVRAYLAHEPRSMDAGIMEFDAGTSSFQRQPMPMGVSSFELSPYVVPSDCTSSLFKQKLNVMGVFHHMHRFGKQMSIELQRDGKDYGPLRLEHGYDFNHQTMEETAVKELFPGDQITVKCTFDTTSATQNVSFGDLTQQEMCFGGIVYYPRFEDAAFYYYPPRADASVCSEPGTGEWANVSRCAQAFSESVPTFFKYADAPFDFDAVTMCNAPWFESEVGWVFDDICPSCHATRNCTAEDVARHAQEDFCVRWCSENANLSLYPDMSHPAEGAFDTGSHGCPNEPYRAPEPIQRATCQKVGDLTLPIPENAAGPRSDDEVMGWMLDGEDLEWGSSGASMHPVHILFISLAAALMFM